MGAPAAPEVAAPEPSQAHDDFAVWGLNARIVVSDPGRLGAARRIADAELATVTAVCSRFDETSELARINADPRRGGGILLSATLAEFVGVALAAAADTDGDVDPTLGGDLDRLGYDRDFATLPSDGVTVTAAHPRGSGWRRVSLDGRALVLPDDLRLDLGATAKAHAADRFAWRIAAETGTDALVSLGGDLATAGSSARLWEVLVQDLPEDPAQQVAVPNGAGVATSSTRKRRWRSGGQVRHHILDPRFGLPAPETWRSVTVAAPSCARANALSTASIVRGLRAVSWLGSIGADARLVGPDGSVVTTGNWPEDAAPALGAREARS